MRKKTAVSAQLCYRCSPLLSQYIVFIECGRWSNRFIRLFPQCRIFNERGRWSNCSIRLLPQCRIFNECGRWSNRSIRLLPQYRVVNERGRWSNRYILLLLQYSSCKLVYPDKSGSSVNFRLSIVKQWTHSIWRIILNMYI
jgi:hypothetical protein